jgi:hypothetical protein
MLLGNGTMGAMVWGSGNVLHITIGRADFWDHQGGYPFQEKYSYDSLLAIYASGKIDTVYDALTERRKEDLKPSVLPIGRFEIMFPEGFSLRHAMLHPADGSLEIHGDFHGDTSILRVLMAQDKPLLMLQSEGVEIAGITPVTAWAYDHAVAGWRTEEPGLAARNIPKPAMLDGHYTGWLQERVSDAPLCIAARRQGRLLAIAADIAADTHAAQAKVTGLIEQGLNKGFEVLMQQGRDYWHGYWENTPEIYLPDSTLQFLYDYGMYKFGAITRPGAVPITLQGPWIEEYQMPPWLSDYHFNINVQMCYWPAYAGNHPEYLLPFFDMLWSWLPVLKENSEIFTGRSGGIKIPHATDDRGVRVIPLLNGGLLDPGSTAWPALMMHKYVNYSQDTAFLSSRGFPFMQLAFNGFYALLKEENGVLNLPLANSPEFYTKPGGKGGLGKNVTFQLICLHELAKALIQAATILGEEHDARWQKTLDQLPLSTIIDGRLAVWEGQPYDRCHRHFSHLAGIYPFDSYDWSNTRYRNILQQSYDEWVGQGSDCYAGWSIPWVVMLHNRFGNPQASVRAIRDWQQIYLNEGYGTLHDAREQRPERMQIEAGLGMAAALLDMMAYEQNDVIHLFAGIPAEWIDVEFDNIALPGGVHISADRATRQIQLTSSIPQVVTLQNPWPGKRLLSDAGEIIEKDDPDLVHITLPANQEVLLWAE